MNIKDKDLSRDGVYWNIEKDHFTFQLSLPEKPFTQRGVLSVINCVWPSRTCIPSHPEREANVTVTHYNLLHKS